MPISTLLAGIGIAMILMVVVTFLHYHVLDLLSRYLPKLRMPPRWWIVLVVLTVYVAHVIEIMLFALVYYVIARDKGWGSFGEQTPTTLFTCFDFSASSFTTLGLTKLVSSGVIQVIASLEGLTGFLLITWSASYGYKTMQDFWGK